MFYRYTPQWYAYSGPVGNCIVDDRKGRHDATEVRVAAAVCGGGLTHAHRRARGARCTAPLRRSTSRPTSSAVGLPAGVVSVVLCVHALIEDRNVVPAISVQAETPTRGTSSSPITCALRWT
jgi:hypothetical protein